MREFGIGQSVPRVEDRRLIQGRGRFVDDHVLPNQVFMVVVRSAYAAARINGVNADAARQAPGVIGVLLGSEAEADGIGFLHTMVQRHKRDGSPMERPPFRILATDMVRYVGDPVAAVVAESLQQAQDAAELVEIDYEPLPAVTCASDAVRPGAPAVWPELVPDNVSFVYRAGDRAAVDAAIASAHHVTTLDYRISRVSANPMEPRAAIGQYDPIDGQFTLIANLQMPHKTRTEIAENTLFIDPQQLHVISPDVGGGFGMKGSPFPEQIMVLWAARRFDRPVRWTATRSESLQSDYHARDNISRVQLALDADGRFLALKVETLANLGAYLSFNTPHSPTNNLGGLSGVYTTPAIFAEAIGVFTHSQPTAPYRGAGRPEATFAIERTIDLAALEMGIDRVDLRRRNVIPKNAMPYDTGFLFVYDSGDFDRNMEIALEAADWSGFNLRQKSSADRGKLRGIALVNAIEVAGGPVAAPNEEGVEIRFDPGGALTLFLGSHNHGQGHETVFRQLAVETLGVDPDRVRVVAGDTEKVVHGRGTFGSRTMTAGGTAFVRAADRIIERGKAVAAQLLECSTGDLTFENGRFVVAGSDRSVTIDEVARQSYIAGKLPRDWEMGLIAQAVTTPSAPNFPNGVHVCEVEIDPETGVVTVLRYLVVDDVGTVINPMLVKGQIHGGVAQGLGQALLEKVVFDETGQLVSGSFMDYAMPRASDLSVIDVVSNPVPTPTNPLGVKGVGEAGAVGALSVVINAIVHALEPLGIRHVDMPATPHRIWRIIQDSRNA
jgi:carbon-monoxide dehydrogenase large subunit